MEQKKRRICPHVVTSRGNHLLHRDSSVHNNRSSRSTIPFRSQRRHRDIESRGTRRGSRTVDLERGKPRWLSFLRSNEILCETLGPNPSYYVDEEVVQPHDGKRGTTRSCRYPIGRQLSFRPAQSETCIFIGLFGDKIDNNDARRRGRGRTSV